MHCTRTRFHKRDCMVWSFLSRWKSVRNPLRRNHLPDMYRCSKRARRQLQANSIGDRLHETVTLSVSCTLIRNRAFRELSFLLTHWLLIARMSELTPLPVTSLPFDEVEDKQLDEKDEIRPTELENLTEKEAEGPQQANSADFRRRLVEQYGRRAEEEGIAPAADITAVLGIILDMSTEEATELAIRAMQVHQADNNFPSWTMEKLRRLVQGYKAADMDPDDWAFELKCEAAMIHYHSPLSGSQVRDRSV